MDKKHIADSEEIESHQRTMYIMNYEKTFVRSSFTLASINGLQNCRVDDQITFSMDESYAYDQLEVKCYEGIFPSDYIWALFLRNRK